MGGGDLNMKKSWHPVLLVNQERVWKAEKAANEDKKMLAQLRKEREEERQLAELQALQEASTGKKRVAKLDWMYAAPGNEGGALGGQNIGERDMEDYLLGKKRVDEVLAAGDRNVGNLHKDFIAVQNANTVRDTASKIREDPLLAIKKQELAAMEAMKNRPEIRRKMMEMQQGKGDSKEERKAKRRAEKEERRKDRHDRREARDRRHRDDRSPRSDYSSDREYRRRSDGGHGSERRYRDASRSPKREYSRDRDYDHDNRRREHSPRRHRDDYDARGRDAGRRDDGRDDRRVRDRDDRSDPRVPPPRHYPAPNNGFGHSNGNGHGPSHGSSSNGAPSHRPHPSRPSAADMMDRPSASTRRPAPAPAPTSQMSQSLEEQRAARLAAMSASAQTLDAQRTKSLAARAEAERVELEKEERMRKKYTSDDVKGVFFGQKTEMGLGEAIGRRNGVGLQRDI